MVFVYIHGGGGTINGGAEGDNRGVLRQGKIWGHSSF